MYARVQLIYSLAMTRAYSSPSKKKRRFALTRFKLFISKAQWQPEIILKIFPLSLEGCYGLSSQERGDHEREENTLRAGPNRNCRECLTAATPEGGKYRSRARSVTESTAKTRGRQAPFATASFIDYFKERPVRSLMDRNSLKMEEGILSGRRFPRQMVWIETQRMEAWTCVACAWAFRPSGPPVGNSLEEMMRNYELQRDKEYASHVCAMCPGTRDAQDASTFSRQAGDRI
jgi:hypothetical protein